MVSAVSVPTIGFLNNTVGSLNSYKMIDLPPFNITGNHHNSEWYKKFDWATGISAWVCLLFILLPALALEVYYICRYKTTFLMRLFFYLTIAGTIVDVNFALTFTVYSQLSFHTYKYSWIDLSFNHFGLLLELFAILLINLNILSKMYLTLYGSDRQFIWLGSTGCIFKKRYEVLLVIFYHLFCAVLSTLVMIILHYKEVNILRMTFNFVPALADMAMCLLSSVILIIWFFKLKRKQLLQNRLNRVCIEMSLLLTFFTLFLLHWPIVVILVHIGLSNEEQLLCKALFPIIHANTPLPFIVYICVTTRQQKDRITRIKELQLQANTTCATSPPSTRVSLPSDTVKHALNFLSPSTAEPTDMTPLLNSRIV